MAAVAAVGCTSFRRIQRWCCKCGLFCNSTYSSSKTNTSCSNYGFSSVGKRNYRFQSYKFGFKTGRRISQIYSNSKADDPLPSQMSLENALELLGVAEHSSFEEILTAKKAILDRNKGNPELAAQVEAAYDTLLMQSLTQRRSGKVVDNSVRFADVKSAGNSSRTTTEWLNKLLKDKPVAFEVPSASYIGIQTGIYGALMAWNIVNGISLSATTQLIPNGSDVPGLVLATSFGASLYFLRRKNVKLGKATAITVGGLVFGAVIGGAVESWLRVDIVPLFGIKSPAVVVSEFVILSQWLSSLCLQ